MTRQPKTLHQRAEAAFREKAAWSPEQLAAMSPEATQQTLHELSVHQIELEVQNEELRRTHVELDAARARYSDLYDLAPVGYCSLSAPGLILQANLTAATQLGVDWGALAGQPISRFIHQEDTDIEYLLRQNLIATGEPQSCELRMVRKDGTQFWAHLASSVTQGADALPVILLVMSDVSERKVQQIQAEHAAEEIRQLNASLEQRVRERTAELEAANKDLGVFSDSVSQASEYARSLIEAALDPLVTISPEGKITDMNEAWIQVTGLPREKLIGTDFLDYFTEPDKARAGYQQVFSEGLVRDYPLAIRHASGRVTDVLYNASVYRDDNGRVLGIFAAARDVTVQKRFEQSLQEASRMKSEFLANMSHELRTPLNGIIGFSEFLLDEKPGPLAPKQREYLNDVLSSGRHLLQLINDVLDLSKVEAGKMTLNPETFRVEKAVEEACAVARAIAQKKRIELHAEVAPELVEVTLDEQKFKQVLYNLLSNAVKFTNDGGRVDILIHPDGAGRFQLQVRDNGIGIRAEDFPKLFQEFTQLDTGTARHYGGTGLGLALTKRIVEFQQGSIAVASEPGEGSTFTVELPRHFPKKP